MGFFKKKKRKRKNISEPEVAKNVVSFFNWVQEFSKKIITITFYIFVTINIYVLVLIWMAYKNSGDILFLDTLITESHLTFREVIGGYFIKAMTENAIKITGSIINAYLKHKMKTDYNVTVTDEDTIEVDESEDDPDFVEEDSIEETSITDEDYPEDELAAAYEE